MKRSVELADVRAGLRRRRKLVDEDGGDWDLLLPLLLCVLAVVAFFAFIVILVILAEPASPDDFDRFGLKHTIYCVSVLSGETSERSLHWSAVEALGRGVHWVVVDRNAFDSAASGELRRFLDRANATSTQLWVDRDAVATGEPVLAHYNRVLQWLRDIAAEKYPHDEDMGLAGVLVLLDEDSMKLLPSASSLRKIRRAGLLGEPEGGFPEKLSQLVLKVREFPSHAWPMLDQTLSQEEAVRQLCEELGLTSSSMQRL